MVAGALMVWGTDAQTSAQAPSGLYRTPAFSGDFSGPYETPAFSGGRVGEAAPAPSLGTGQSYRSRAGELTEVPAYGSGAGGAYFSPAFQGPEVGILLTPGPARAEKPDTKSDSAAAPGTSAPATPTAKPNPAVESLGTPTNHIGSVAPSLPTHGSPTAGTNNLPQP